MKHALSAALTAFIFLVFPYTANGSGIGADSPVSPVLNIGGTDWPPYFFQQSSGQAAGSDYRLLTDVLDELNYQLALQILPEKRVSRGISQGNIDVVVGAAYNEHRAENNYFSIPYREEVISFAYLAQNHRKYAGQRLEDLLAQGKTLALNTTGWYGERFANDIAPLYASQLIHIDSVERRLELLHLGRVDLALDDVEVLSYNASQFDIDLVVSADAVQRQPVHFMFSKNAVDEKFMTRFDALLSQQIHTHP